MLTVEKRQKAQSYILSYIIENWIIVITYFNMQEHLIMMSTIIYNYLSFLLYFIENIC